MDHKANSTLANARKSMRAMLLTMAMLSVMSCNDRVRVEVLSDPPGAKVTMVPGEQITKDDPRCVPQWCGDTPWRDSGGMGSHIYELLRLAAYNNRPPPHENWYLNFCGSKDLWLIGEIPALGKPTFPKKVTTFELKKDGFESVSVPAVYAGDDPDGTHVYRAQARLRKMVAFKYGITSTPTGASVSLVGDDGQSMVVGATPFAGTVSCLADDWRDRRYVVSLPGHFPHAVVCGKSDEDQAFTIPLEPLPSIPDSPAFVYPDPKQVVVTPVDLDSRPDAKFSFAADQTIAIMRLSERGQDGSGSLAADSLIIALQRQGRNVIERDKLEQIAREQGLMAEGKASITDKELAEKLGKLLKADYFMYGAITEYAAQDQNVSLSPVLEPAKAAEYENQVKTAREAYQRHNMPFPGTVKSVEQWNMEMASKTRQSFMNVARVGVTAKIIEVSTGKIVWVGIASASDTTLQNGMRRIVDGMVKDIVKNRP